MLLMSAFIVALAPMISVSVVSNITAGKRSSNCNSSSEKSGVDPTAATSGKPQLDSTSVNSLTNVFLSSRHQLKIRCKNLKMVDEYPLKVFGTLQMLLSSLIPSIFLNAASMRNSSKSFDNFWGIFENVFFFMVPNYRVCVMILGMLEKQSMNGLENALTAQFYEQESDFCSYYSIKHGPNFLSRKVLIEM